MEVKISSRRAAGWLLPSAVGLVLLFLLPDPLWPFSFLPALAGHLRSSRRDDLHRPLTLGFVLACMSPFILVTAAAAVLALSPSLEEHLPPDWVSRAILFLAWTVSIYTLWRRSLRPSRPAPPPS